MNRSERKKAKRKNIKKYIFVGSFFIFSLVVYWVYQYTTGMSLADDAKAKEKNEAFEDFQGADSQFGEINVLLLGSDARTDEDARSDALMIAHYDQSTNAVKIVSLMRDTYVDIPNHGKKKLNSAFSIGGPELVRKTIKQNFDIDVQYYAIVDFNGFSKIVDVIAPDGIKVDIPYEMSHGIDLTLEPGKQTLHGKELLGYVRFRHDNKSDFGRVERQQEALSKLKDEAVSVHTLLNVPKLLGVVDPYIETNITNRTLLTIGKGLLVGDKSKDIESLRIPVEGSYKNKRVNVGAVLDIDIAQNREALKAFLSPKGEEKQVESEEPQSEVKNKSN